MRRLCLVYALCAIGCGDDTQPLAPDAAPDAAMPDATIDGPAPSDIGGPCSSPQALQQGTCATGEICATPDVGYPGGYCSQDCSSRPCPWDASCLSAHGGMYCVKTCAHDTDCRAPDYSCQNGGCDVRPNVMPSLPPGTNNGAACVMPIVNPPGTGSLFETDKQVSSNAFAAETNLAVDPATHHIVVAYIDIGTSGRPTIGAVASQDDGATFGAPTLLPMDTTVDMNTYQSDPIVAVDPSGNFFIAWVGFDLSASTQQPTNMIQWVARSTDSGASWQIVRVSPANEEGTGLMDKPWIAASPVDGALTFTWLRDTPAAQIRAARSTDHGLTWSAPITVDDGTRSGFRNLAQVTYGADGKAYVVWLELNGGQFGDPANQVYFQRLAADGTLDGGNVLVSGAGDSPGFDDPSVAVSGSNVYVGFASGNATGAWDIRVAASTDDGATFGASVKVNDDATCATHYHHQIAVDGSGRLHAIWYDNRYLFGSVLHAQSPAATSTTPLAFGASTFVNSASFAFSTRRDIQLWEGDYLGLSAVGSSLYAVWSDPRVGGVAHIQFAKGTVP